LQIRRTTSTRMFWEQTFLPRFLLRPPRSELAIMPYVH
jgi:hypothetical protein